MLASYDDLKSAIESWLDRDDLTSRLDDFIRLAEARMEREVRIREMLQRDALTIGSRYVDLPTGFLEAENIRILSDPVQSLLQVSPFEMDRIRQETSAKPTAFAVRNEIEFDYAPDSSYSGEITFFKKITGLSDSNPANEVLDAAPDLYLYACLAVAAPFVMDDERIAQWNALYTDARDRLNNQQRRSRRIGPQIVRVAGATP